MSTSAPAIGPPAFMVAWAVQICVSAPLMSAGSCACFVWGVGRNKSSRGGILKEQPSDATCRAPTGSESVAPKGVCVVASVQQIPCLHQRGPLALDVTLARLLEPLVERLALLLSLAVWELNCKANAPLEIM